MDPIGFLRPETPLTTDVRRTSDESRTSSSDVFSTSLARAIGKLPVAPTPPAPITAARAPAAEYRSFSTEHPRVAAEPSLNERALALRAYRQQLLASNMANADTPNYKAVDIDVEEALRTGKTAATVEVQQPAASQPSIDGNTVDMDAERAKFASNTIGYQFSLDRVGGHFKDIIALLNNTR